MCNGVLDVLALEDGNDNLYSINISQINLQALALITLVSRLAMLILQTASTVHLHRLYHQPSV